VTATTSSVTSLTRGYELAASRLEGINEAALELATRLGTTGGLWNGRFASSPNECASTRAMQQAGGLADPSRNRVGHVEVGLG
jgi:hypothetical protein